MITKPATEQPELRKTYHPQGSSKRGSRTVVTFITAHGGAALVFYEEDGVRTYCTGVEWERWVKETEPVYFVEE